VFQREAGQRRSEATLARSIVEEVFGLGQERICAEAVRSEAEEGVRRGLGAGERGSEPLSPCLLAVEDRLHCCFSALGGWSFLRMNSPLISMR
jgi:hypothetical protein